MGWWDWGCRREEAREGDRAGQVEGGRQQHQRERRPQDQREQAPLQEEQVSLPPLPTPR